MLCVLMAAGLATAACGSKVPHADHLAAATGTVQPGTVGPADTLDPDSTDVSAGVPAAGGDTAGGDPAAGVSTPDGGPASPTGDAPGGEGAQAAGCQSPRPTLQIGSVGELSGVFAPFTKPLVEGVRIWVQAVNARGGVNCHPLNYTALDDRGDPALHQSLVRKLVEETKVIAMVGMAAPVAGNSSVDYLTSKGIPVIGSEGGSEWFYSSPMFFPQMTSGNAAISGVIAGLGVVGKPLGRTKMALVSCIEVSICAAAYDAAPAAAKDAGLQLVYRGRASLTQPSFTSSCQAAHDAGADVFGVGLDTNSVQRLIRDCHRLGYDPVFLTAGVLATPALAADPELDGLYFASYVIPFTNTSNQHVKALIDALGRFAPGAQATPGVMAGWTAGVLFETAAPRMPGPLTSGSLVDGLETIKDDDLGGITQPLTFTAGKTAARGLCFWIMQASDGAFRVTGHPDRTCV